MHTNKKNRTPYSNNTSKYLRNVQCHICYKFCYINYKFYYIKLTNWRVQLFYWKFIALFLCRLFPCDTPTKAIRFAYSPCILTIRVVHGSGWVKFVLNLQSTLLDQVDQPSTFPRLRNQSNGAIQPCNRFWVSQSKSKIWDTSEKTAKSRWYFHQI